MGTLAGVTLKRTGWIGRPEDNRSGREIRPRLNYDTCNMCGRTILTGEKVELFASTDPKKPLVVCPHCRTQAREAGLSKAG